MNRPRVSLAGFLPLGLFMVVLAALGFAAVHPSDGDVAGLVDRPLPDFSLRPIPGKNQGLASQDMAGRVTILHVFAAWCSTCRASQPELVELSKETEVPFFGLNWKDKPGAGKVFLARYGDPFSAVGSDADGRLGRTLGVTGVPETYVVDAKGQIRYRHVGAMNRQTWEEILQPLLEKLGTEKDADA